MALRPHFSGKIRPFFIFKFFSFFVVNEVHCFHREREKCATTRGPIRIEPLHRELLKPGNAFPLRLRSVGENKIFENCVEICFIVVRNIPEPLRSIRGATPYAFTQLYITIEFRPYHNPKGVLSISARLSLLPKRMAVEGSRRLPCWLSSREELPAIKRVIRCLLPNKGAFILRFGNFLLPQAR